jgi:hypothetical protein
MKTLIVCLFVLFDAPCFAEDGPVWFNPKTKRLEFRGDPVNGYAQRKLIEKLDRYGRRTKILAHGFSQR